MVSVAGVRVVEFGAYEARIERTNGLNYSEVTMFSSFIDVNGSDSVRFCRS